MLPVHTLHIVLFAPLPVLLTSVSLTPLLPHTPLSFPSSSCLQTMSFAVNYVGEPFNTPLHLNTMFNAAVRWSAILYILLVVNLPVGEAQLGCDSRAARSVVWMLMLGGLGSCFESRVYLTVYAQCQAAFGYVWLRNSHGCELAAVQSVVVSCCCLCPLLEVW